MDHTVIDAHSIYERGLADPQALAPEERLVYLVQELEIMADMECWDHFFTSHIAHFLGELKAGLSAAGDLASLAVLRDYERQLSEQGVLMEPKLLERFLAAQDETYFANERDWREEFDDLSEERWAKVEQYLSGKGIRLS